MSLKIATGYSQADLHWL